MYLQQLPPINHQIPVQWLIHPRSIQFEASTSAQSLRQHHRNKTPNRYNSQPKKKPSKPNPINPCTFNSYYLSITRSTYNGVSIQDFVRLVHNSFVVNVTIRNIQITTTLSQKRNLRDQIHQTHLPITTSTTFQSSDPHTIFYLSKTYPEFLYHQRHHKKAPDLQHS